MPTEILVLIPVVALALALGALLLPPRWRSRGALLGASIATIATTTMFATNGQPTPELEVAERPIAEPIGGYVGSAACRSCHPQEHDTWHDSYHRTMTQVASPKTVLGDFQNVEFDVKGEHYKLGQDGDDYWVEFADPFGGTGGEVLRVRRRIALTTGSHNMQAYWFESQTGRILGQLPLSWQVEEKRWITRDASFVLPPDENHSLQFSSWNFVCIKCHATQGRPKMEVTGNQFSNADTRVAELGIACESCHGPGGEHVSANQNPLRRYSQRMSDEPDDTIINPANLDPKRSTQVCGQCHAVWDYKLTGNRMMEWFDKGFDYRPGGDVEKNRDPQLANKGQDTAFWSDGLIRTAGREYNALHGSACHEKGGMTCLSCHQMHQAADDSRPRKQWANDQLLPGEDNASCLKCHEQYGKDIAAHTHHEVGSSGSSCVNCHMPHTTYGLMKGVRTHRIESPSAKVSVRTGRPNACNQCHLDQTLLWTATKLSEWYEQEIPQMTRADQTLAASVQMAMAGDAGQRALLAWSFGWPEAQAVSGTDWLAPYLAELLVDPYPAVRIIAERSLRTLPSYETFRHRLDTTPDLRQRAKADALTKWTDAGGAKKQARPAVLIKPDGSLQTDEFGKLLKRRNNKKIRLVE
ncbi:MAG: formate-dependent nitrite reductase cytochrome c552 subunit [Planctomycetota bacterium]|jgi:formate-dependent nitrite reductase cytochrome c552 subunit